jgi:hypothetical protein
MLIINLLTEQSFGKDARRWSWLGCRGTPTGAGNHPQETNNNQVGMAEEEKIEASAILASIGSFGI